MEWWEISEFRERGVPFAIDANGVWQDVDAVPRGRACGCRCPDCKGNLIARQGDVRVHHFAHDDRRECRHALEASLYGMAIRLLTEPEARLMLPVADPIAGLACEMSLTPDEVRTFAAPPIAPSGPLVFDSAEARTTDLHHSVLDLPDLVVPGHKLAIHLLSHKKNFEQAKAAPRNPDTCVVGINLRAYVNIWWEVCDGDQETTIRAVGQARELMGQWLAGQTSGRGWLHHPELERAMTESKAVILRTRAEREAALQRELAERTAADRRKRVEAEERRRAEEGRWKISPRPDADPQQLVMKPATAEAQSWLTPSLATTFDLEWHRDRRLYFYVGHVGEVVPELAREYLDRDAPWEGVRPADEKALQSFLPSALLPAPPGSTEPRVGPTRQSADLPDEFLRDTGKKCWCGAAVHEVIFGAGYYAGRRALRCSANQKHPITLLGP
jgi:hypothetical protein